jgi:UDPglucose 6-dehydrogenase
LRFTTDLKTGIAEADAAFICVGTPQSEDGSADMQYVLMVAGQLGDAMALRPRDARPLIVVDKSTVPVGTAARVHAQIAAHTDRAFEVVSNPEFLREGSAIGDFLEPDRVVVGCRTDHAETVMKALYQPFLDRSGGKWFRMDPPSAELTKYAANAMLALRISFINEIANLAESVGADVDHVKSAIGADHRIGPAFLNPGPGFGGSCFPKDLQALLKVGREHGQPMMTLASTVEANRHQKQVLLRKLKAHFSVKPGVPAPLKGRRFALWGLAFKANTDDIRESMSLELIEGLLTLGAEVVVHDFAAMDAVKAKIGDKVRYAATPLAACEGADALLISTEWPQYREADLEAVAKALKARRIFDGRNLFRPEAMETQGWTYLSIGRRAVVAP